MASFTVAQADTYFATRLGASTYWTAEAEQLAALTTAENQIAAVYGAAAVALDVVCEQALFLLRNLDKGLDERADLKAQGVTTAGVVKESYNKLIGNNSPTILPFAPYVRERLGAPPDPTRGLCGEFITLEE